MTQKQTEAREELNRRLESHDFLTQAIQKAVVDAVLDHKRAGNPIVGWQNGRVVWIEPEDIVLDGEKS